MVGADSFSPVAEAAHNMTKGRLGTDEVRGDPDL
jgi:hypothetical protein